MKLHLSWGNTAWLRAICAVSLAAGSLVGDASAQWCGPRCVPCNPAPYYGRPAVPPDLPAPGQPTPAESMLGGTPNESAGGMNPGDLMGDPAVDSSASLGQPSANDFAMDSGIGGGEGGSTDMGGYINQASLANRIRFRYDRVNGGNTDAAEFLYGAYFINGRPAIQNYDYNDGSVYLETMLTCRMSAFVEGAYRFADYDDFGIVGAGNQLGARRRESGFTDMNAGVRYALIDDCCEKLTGQLKVIAPTGDTFQGLGTGHVSIEPGALYQRDFDRLHLFSEVHDWISLSDIRVPGNFPQNAGRLYGGNVLRYGVGAGFDVARACDRQVTLLAEVVGWSVLYGMKNQAFGAGGLIADAAGDTVVNVKVGARYTQGCHSLYAGFGQPITGLRWYDNLFRVDYTYAGW